MCITTEGSYLLNSIGLIFEMAGVIVIFVLRDKGLKEPQLKELTYPQIKDNDLYPELNIPFDTFKETQKVLEEIKQNIRITNERNDKVYKKSKIGLLLIIIGFLLSLLANLHYLHFWA